MDKRAKGAERYDDWEMGAEWEAGRAVRSVYQHTLGRIILRSHVQNRELELGRCLFANLFNGLHVGYAALRASDSHGWRGLESGLVLQ